jgi:3,4-dihydroxy 2-butanone 4-phosphate synthase / GTP cyclohydrolase II
MTIVLDSVKEAIEDIKNGKIVIVVDDENRENEGDMICASECVTPEIVNFMLSEARGLLCVALTKERCAALNLNLMVENNTALHKTAFTVSVDLIGYGCTTGVSTGDRAKTINALADPKMEAKNFAIANTNGLTERHGHTEAAIDLPRMAGLKPSGVLIEVLSPDGSMARLPELREIANKFNLKLISIKDILEYVSDNDPNLEIPAKVKI